LRLTIEGAQAVRELLKFLQEILIKAPEPRLTIGLVFLLLLTGMTLATDWAGMVRVSVFVALLVGSALLIGLSNRR